MPAAKRKGTKATAKSTARSTAKPKASKPKGKPAAAKPKPSPKPTSAAKPRPPAAVAPPVPAAVPEPTGWAAPPAMPAASATSGWTALPAIAPVPTYAPPLRPLGGLAAALPRLLFFNVALAALDFALSVGYRDWLDPTPSPGLDAVQTLLDVLAIGIGIATVVVVCMWFYRVLANAQMTHTAAGIRPGWAVGSFFIPLAHLILPYFEIRKGWKADVGEDSGPVTAWFVPWSLGVAIGYIGAILGASLAFQAVGFLMDDPDASDDEIEAEAQDLFDQMRPYILTFQGIGLALNLVAAFYLARLCRMWTEHQAGPPPVGPPAS